MRPSLPLVLTLVACQEYTITPDKPEDPEPPVDTDVVVAVGQPDIEVSPAELRFGGLPPNCFTEPQILTITNKGDARLEVDSASLAGRGNEAFALSEAGPWKLRPGETVEVEVTFGPLDYVAYETVRVEVASNDPDEAVVKVPARGEGAEATYREDLFSQGLATAVDVLWVVDTSESMLDEQQALGRKMNVFISSFVNLGLDYHLAVTSTDMLSTGLQGEFAGPWMSSADAPATVASTFESQVVSLGAAGSADEKGFAAAKAALSGAPSTRAPNQGFLRADATLAIVAVSDEDDRDATPELPGASMNARVVNDFVTWLQGRKADPGDVTFSSMSGPASGGLSACAVSTGRSATAAPAYFKATRDTGGVWSNICNFDVTPFLQHLSFVAAGLEFRFPLSGEPLSVSPAVFTVEVTDADGNVTELPFDALDGWTYDSSENAVETHGSGIPEPGSSVRITYPVESSCD